jgi:hypothetical protein
LAGEKRRAGLDEEEEKKKEEEEEEENSWIGKCLCHEIRQ